MGLLQRYKAYRQEKLRQRLLMEAYARRAENERMTNRDQDRNYESRRRPSDFKETRSHGSHRHESPPRPRTTPSHDRERPMHRKRPDPFDTDSDDDLPSWLGYSDRFYDNEQVRHNESARRAVPRQAVRHQNSERAMPDIASPWPRRFDSLPRREEPTNYHPRHGHRYLRPDEQIPREVPEYVQPLSYGRRGTGEVRGYRGRRFGQGGPPPPPPKRTPSPGWAGEPPPGWF